MRRSFRASVLLACGLLVAGACASSTKVVSTWKAPNVAQERISRVLVVVPARDGALRRKAEDDLVKRLPVPAVPSYTFISDADAADFHAYEPEITRRGFDGIVSFRIVSVDREQTWIPGTYAGRYYAYGGWPVYDPGYVDVDTTVRVDTNVYALPGRELVWASSSETFDPSSARDLVDDVADVVIKKMVKDGVFPAG